ncbi:MAG: DpnI domain-containing protein [Caldisphaera sp.]
MSKSQDIGNAGEKDVVKKVKCPNCKRKLMLLPKNYPMADVQCTGCYFRAQVKTKPNKPQDNLSGAGWDIMEKCIKAGHPVPPLIINFKWKGGQEIRFYPFIPKDHLKKRVLSPTARRANYRMFNYFGLTKLPYFVLYRKLK